MSKNKAINFLESTALICLYGIAFFLPISKAIIQTFLYLAIFCFLVKKILERKWIIKTKINYAIFAYFFICLISIFLSSNFKISFRSFLGKVLQNIAFLFLVIETLKTERRIKNILYLLFASSFVLGIDGIYQYFTHHDFIRNRPYYWLDRIHATFSTANDFACYLNMVIPFLLALIFAKLRIKFRRLFFIFLFFVLLICLLLTASRGGWLGFLGSVLFMSIWINALGVFFLFLGALILFTHRYYPLFLKERLSNPFAFSDGGSLDRERIWEAAIRMVKTKPWLGLGLGTFMFNFYKFINPGYLYSPAYAHNCYLQIAAEIGIIGLVAFLSILVLFFTYGIEVVSYRQRSYLWYVLLACLAAILGFCLQMSVDTNFYALDLGMLFWMALGIGVSAMKLLEVEA